MTLAFDAVRKELVTTDIRYLRTLRDGSMSRQAFVESQRQFHSAVIAFPKAMETLAARADATARAVLVANVRDEMGAGDPAHSHDATFRELLMRLGVGKEALDSRVDGMAVQCFNNAVTSACRLAPPAFAIAMLGMIEELFAGISAAIGRGIVTRGWLPEADLIHYPTHEHLDLEHSESFYRLVRHDTATNAVLGLHEGADVFLRFYDDLARECLHQNAPSAA